MPAVTTLVWWLPAALHQLFGEIKKYLHKIQRSFSGDLLTEASPCGHVWTLLSKQTQNYPVANDAMAKVNKIVWQSPQRPCLQLSKLAPSTVH